MYVRMEGVLVKQDGARGEVGDVEMIREALVLQVIDRFLYCDDVPFPRNVLLDSPWRSSSRSRVPAQDADSRLLKHAVRPTAVKSVLKVWRQSLLFEGLADRGCHTTFNRHVAVTCTQAVQPCASALPHRRPS